MSANKTTIWDAVISIAPGICILLFCLGIGGCSYLCDKGTAEREKAKSAASP